MIGDRMRQARLASGMTLEEVAEHMDALGHPITRAGLSKYERNKSTPGQAFLAALGNVLRVKTAFFVSEPGVSIEWLGFRKQAKMPKSRQEQIKAFATQVVESQIWLQGTLYPDEKANFPARTSARSVEDAERVAESLRGKWNLGEGSIDSLTGMVEDRGGIVVSHGAMGTGREFDGLAGWANETIPVAVVSNEVPDDRVRYTLAHELGHLLMDCAEVDPTEEEKLAHRFASALIVPAAVMRRELGRKRRRLAARELAILKRKYGLSMQSLIRRAFDLQIIEASQYKALFAEFSRLDWRKKEPVEYVGDEKPARLLQMTLRAVTEGIITKERAERICPGCTSAMPGQTEQPDTGLRAPVLRRLPQRRRDAILMAAADEAVSDYLEDRQLTDFEAFSEEELNEREDGAV